MSQAVDTDDRALLGNIDALCEELNVMAQRRAVCVSGKEGGVSKWRFHFQRSDAMCSTTRRRFAKSKRPSSSPRSSASLRRTTRRARGWGGDAMNCEIHQLSPLRCEAFQAKEVLRAVLHTVIFGRTLGVVRPRDVDCELFDLTYVTCGDAEAERAVDEKLDALVAWLRKQDLPSGRTGRVRAGGAELLRASR